MSDLLATVDHIGTKKFKKESGYETTLAKLLDKTKKAKVGKVLYEVRSKGDTMKFRAKGKKAAPVNILDYSKIRNLTKTSPTEKAIAFAYPGPDEKNPLMLYAIRFEKEDGYEKFTERVEFPPPSEYRDSEYMPAVTERMSHYSEQEYQKNGGRSSSDRYRRSKSRSHARGSTVTTSSSSSSSNSTSSSTPKRISRSKSKRQKNVQSKKSFISTDNALSPYRSKNRNPSITLELPYRTTYISTKSRIRDSPSSSRRAYSARSSYSYPSTTRFRNRNYSTSSSDFSNDEYDDDYYDRSVSENRRYVISRCRRGPSSGIKCRPVGEFIVSEKNPRYF
ncbi:unnamed protein product [Hymenolepis diminuta]|uniref:DUF5734 domain-containing protein n=1 Tax=Hymenolepis diminuta TaxID=6216 RepID=A0A564YW43_HYMDI|nr:unnamed protein product [Hymenolepis diminuta]